MLDRLTSMSAFVKAADTGSFTRAAAALDMSAQMVAKHVGSLEAQLGGQLIARTTRHQSLTELGRAYYERCKVILTEVESADDIAAQVKAAPRGRLRISAPSTFGANGLIPLMTRYQAKNPEVEIDLVLTDRLVDLVDEGFEAVFRVGKLDDSGLLARKLKPYGLAIAAAPSYLARKGIPKVPADLAGHDCLIYSQQSLKNDHRWHFRRHGENHSVRVKGPFQANNVQALLSAAAGGAGIVLVAEDALAEKLGTGQLVRLLAGYEPPLQPMHLLYSPDRRQTPKLRRFIDETVRSLAIP